MLMTGVSKLPLGIGIVDVVDPATRSLHAAAAEVVGLGGHWLSEVQLLWSIVHLPGVLIVGQYFKSRIGGEKILMQGLPSTLHVPP